MRFFPRRRHRRLALVGGAWLVLLVSVGLMTSSVEGRSEFPPRWETHTDAGLARVVDAVARRGGSKVWCWSTDDWSHRRDPWKRRVDVWEGLWGAYTWDVDIHISPNDCAVLKLLRTSKARVWAFRNPETLAWSTLVLAHESWHFAGYSDERQATCWGLQRVAELAVALGRTPREGRYLARVAWTDWYPRVRESYRSRECRDGGRLDLNQKRHVWP